MTIPEQIKNVRNSLGETQAQFAKRFNTQANTVSRWESGQYQASYECIEFVIGYATTELWQVCSRCHGLGRTKGK